MTAPDDGQAATLPGAGLGTRLRAELMETVARSQTELVARILDSFQREHDRLIFDQGRIWRYDTATGLFLTVEDAEIRNIVYDLDGIPFGERGHLSVTAHFARGIAQIIKDRTSRIGFFGNPPTGVAVANGFLMEQDSHVVLRPHSPEHRQQFRLEISYRPDADASAIDDFLLETFEGDQSLVNLIYEIMGVAIFGCGTRYQVVFVFFGEGGNGKGVIVQLIQKLIPPKMRSSVSPSEMHLDYQRYPLVNSRFNQIGELPPFEGRNLQVLKSICAGDTITVRRVRETGFEFTPMALHVFSTNKLPKLRETGEAIERRFRVAPFHRVVPEENRIDNLADKLFDRGAEGLLRRASEGFGRVLQCGRFSNPKPVRVATLAWIHHSDPVRVFAQMKLEHTDNPNDRISAGNMFKRCCEFCNANKLPLPASMREVKDALKPLGFSDTKSSSMYWIGVRFRDDG